MEDVLLPTRCINTLGMHGYNVKFSPYDANILAITACENFGISGGGRLLIADLNRPNNEIVNEFPWLDGLFDLTWSEDVSNCIVTGSGDGTLQMWNIDKPQFGPIKVLNEHQREVSSVEWIETKEHPMFVSSSWDGTVKVWDANYVPSIATLIGHEQLVYQASWSPHIPSCVASVSGDSSLKIWNVKSGNGPNMSVYVGGSEVLCCNWNKYNSNMIVTGDSNGFVAIWDLRRLTGPVTLFQAHDYAIKKVKFSPYHIHILATVSYDFCTKTWVTEGKPMSLQVGQAHTEFVYGLDFSNLEEGAFVDCSWDETIALYKITL